MAYKTTVRTKVKIQSEDQEVKQSSHTKTAKEGDFGKYLQSRTLIPRSRSKPLQVKQSEICRQMMIEVKECMAYGVMSVQDTKEREDKGS